MMLSACYRLTARKSSVWLWFRFSAVACLLQWPFERLLQSFSFDNFPLLLQQSWTCIGILRPLVRQQEVRHVPMYLVRHAIRPSPTILTKITLTYSNPTYSNLTYSNLTYSTLTYSKPNLTYSNLTYSKPNLTYSNLTYSNLTYSNLTYFNLTYSWLNLN
jgi:uncharacterized protein YjbI with pentapeptide repeats